MNLKNKNILLTGGSLGIGKETAKYLTNKGAKVLITGRSSERLKKSAFYNNAKTLVFDISNLKDIKEIAKECIDILDGKIDNFLENSLTIKDN